MLFALSLLPAFLYLLLIIDALWGYRKPWWLREVPIPSRAVWPLVSIVAAARNEERKIAEGVRSLLALDYPAMELVVIDDRSTDRTGEVLQGIAATDPRLRIVTVRELPPHWLGKNHALQLGADEAKGELLLFTDADVVLEPTCLKRAVAYMEESSIDHLTCAPEMTGGTLALRMFVAAFSLFFSMYARPWKAPDPKSRAHVGVGAFNLLRTALYRKFGGHSRIAMRPDDDMKLGKLVKLAGGSQRFISGAGMVRVEWYSTLPEAIDGLMKNSFSGVDYSYGMLIGATVVQAWVNLWPFIGLLVCHGGVRVASAISAGMIIFVSGTFSRGGRMSPWFGFTFPISTVIFLYVLWKAAIRTSRQGGIRWRETLYPLDELRANRV
ncbi:MAG TPA: glycosyltransferase [Thermoanaerobaculia bacterium]|nr:glycosyltransferase [Thermoanaerobaculia bacterium]